MCIDDDLDLFYFILLVIVVEIEVIIKERKNKNYLLRNSRRRHAKVLPLTILLPFQKR